MSVKAIPGRPSPLHPLTFELQGRHAHPRRAVEASWLKVLPGVTKALPSKLASGVPLVASRELLSQLDKRVDEMHRWLKPRLGGLTAGGSDEPLLDVLALDLAIVEDLSEPLGWGLRWVEFQAFSSALATVGGLHRAHTLLWPELEACPPWNAVPGGANWAEYCKTWLAPRENSVLLEDRPDEQSTGFDFAAAKVLWGLPIVDTADVRVTAGEMSRQAQDGTWKDVSHVSNRVILHKAENAHALADLLATATVSWHSHPSGYYRINKGLMPDLPMRPEERCARADQWRSLGLLPSALALKAVESHAGVDVNLHVTEEVLNSLEAPESWIVQPKYKPLPLFESSTGEPIFGEIRCMVLLRAGAAPWLAGRFARLSGGEKVSVSSQLGAEGEGITVLHSPPSES